MTLTQAGWEVIDEDAGVFTREYEFTKNASARSMTARMADGRLAVISPPWKLDDGAYKDLEAHGGVGAQIACNGFHYYGLKEWQQAFPEMTTHAPAIAAKRIAKKVTDLPPMDTLADLAPRMGDSAAVFEAPGQKMGETWLSVQTAAGPIWYVGDSFVSMAELPGSFMGSLIFRLTGSAPGFRLNGIILKLLTSDKPAYKRFMLERIEAEAPVAVVTAHGEVMRTPGLGEQMRAQIEARF